MTVYKIIIHSDLEVDRSGNVKSDIGHFYVQFQGPDVKSNMEFFGKNPLKAKRPYSDGSINPKYEADRNADSKKFDKASKIISKEINLTKEQFNKAYQYAKALHANPEKYIGIFNDCIDFTQEIYRAAGQKGHFAQLYTRDEMISMNSWAATSFKFIPFQCYQNRDDYKEAILKVIEDETHVFIAHDGSMYEKKPGVVVRGIIKNALDFLGYKETKETLSKFYYKKDIPALLKILNEEFVANKDTYIAEEVLKECGSPILNDQPTIVKSRFGEPLPEKPVIDYSSIFDVSSQVDSSMQIIKGCKSNSLNQDPNILVSYEPIGLNEYWGCGTQLGRHITLNLDPPCIWAQKYPAQIDQPFITEKHGVISKDHFLFFAMNSYSKHSPDCLDLALQHTTNVDIITANHADRVYPTIFIININY